MDKLNKLSIPATILIASIVLGGFYYASEANKQASIERQQQAELKAKKDQESAVSFQQEVEKSQRALCKSEAELNAVDLNKASCDRGEYCLKGENMYLVTQYNNAYNTCLQGKGLK